MTPWVTVVLLCIVSVVSSARIPLTKCCSSGQVYDLGNNKCKEMSGFSSLEDWPPPVHSAEGDTLESLVENFHSMEKLIICADGFVEQSSSEFTLFADGTIKVQNISSTFQPEAFCIDNALSLDTSRGKFAARFCVPDSCLTKICVRKCCPLGYGIHEKLSQCAPTTKEFVVEFKNETGHPVDQPADYVIQSGIYPNCSDGMTILDPFFDPQDAFYVLTSGIIHYPMYKDDPFIPTYCLDEFGDENSTVSR